jgi:DNA-binding transcriptional LysR family regulator
VDTNTLRWFAAVADGATVAEAAVQGHTTQPAVTRGLHRLAAEIGVPLTERAGRRLRLTFAGEILADAARRIVAELDAAARGIAEADDPAAGTVRLGFLAPLGTWLIPRLLTEFHADRPAVQFELRHDGMTRILRTLHEGELDMLVTAAPSDPGLHWEPLFKEELMLAMPNTHAFAHRRRVRAEALADERWVLMPEGHGLRHHVEELAASAGFRPRRAFEGHDLATLYALIEAGSGIGLFPTRPAPPEGVSMVSLSPRRERLVGLLTRPEGRIPASASAFADLVRQRAPELAAPR